MEEDDRMDIDVYIGQIQLFAFNFAPRGWRLCNGDSLPINQNQALYALIGTTYGGDGQTSFKIPDLTGASPVPNMNYYIAVQGIFPSRD